MKLSDDRLIIFNKSTFGMSCNAFKHFVGLMMDMLAMSMI